MRMTRRKEDKRHMRNGISLMTCCVVFFAFLIFPGISQAQYPWEKDNITHNITPPPQYNVTPLPNYLTFGVFKASVPGGWIEFPAGIDPELEGQAIIKVKEDGTSINITVDEDPFIYSDNRDLVLYEKFLSKDIGKNSPDAIRHMKILGNKTLVIRQFDEGDGSTLFFIFPYDGTACHPTYVMYEQRVNRLTEEVVVILSSLQFRD